MCGICGQYKFNNDLIDRPLIRRMAKKLYHRGPDDGGFYFENKMGLGHRRLSIIDLKLGRQPMSNEDQTVWIAGNNEIYNFVELRNELESKGHCFGTNSDTEVIVHLYEDLGERCVEKLIGMFAFAVWDKKKKKLFLARDRFGIKPLHYFYDKNNFIFASEIKALLEYKDIDKTFDFSAIDRYFTFLYTIEPNTVFKKIHKLAPAHYLVCQDGEVSIRKYWGKDFLDVKKFSEKYYLEKLKSGLDLSVKMTLRSDVPVGVFLSGGIDSSVISGLASKYNVGLKTFSVTFAEKIYSEERFSRLMAEKFLFDHHELVLSVTDAFNAIPKIVSMLDEPFADSSCIPTYYVSKLARKYVKTVLTGEGGDELFAGYPWHVNKIVKKNSLSFLLRPCEKMIFDSDMRNELYLRDFAKQIKLDRCEGINIDAGKLKKLNILNKLLYIDLRTYLPSDMLVKVDRMSMLNSLEARLPFLNHDFAEFASNIPAGFKIKDGVRKYILKKAFGGFLPKQIINRRKMGFAIPIDIWLWQKNKFSSMIYEVLSDKRTKNRGFFNSNVVKKMFHEHQNLIRLHGHRIWTLFMFEMWHRNFMDGN